eukprot:TRINITY_DN5366_c0_g1_i1.p1 TRINITY_DN5366_c0_g1~~TRINITY_DN5366_c0_g1_i1.p1  ORF type:complete len:344 (+),score=65.79 TRINITY_DN5366_c0_g1_i1:93-1034(+)
MPTDGAEGASRCDAKDASRPSGCAAASPMEASTGGVAWLLTAISQEKVEKAWLASKYEWLEARYDEKCVEVKMLSEELAAARSDLQLAQSMLNQSRGSKLPGRSLAATCIVKGAMPLTGVSGIPADAFGTAPMESSQCGTGADVSTPNSSCRGQDNSLRARRHMDLGSIVTPNKKHDSLQVLPSMKEESESAPSTAKSPASAKSPPCGETSGSHTVERERYHDVSAVLETQDRSIKKANADLSKEPMSALLRRRKEDWSVHVPASQAKQVASSEMPSQLLKVVPTKVMCLTGGDDDPPCSPKRGGNRRSRSVF